MNFHFYNKTLKNKNTEVKKNKFNNIINASRFKYL